MQCRGAIEYFLRFYLPVGLWPSLALGLFFGLSAVKQGGRRRLTARAQGHDVSASLLV